MSPGCVAMSSGRFVRTTRTSPSLSAYSGMSTEASHPGGSTTGGRFSSSDHISIVRAYPDRLTSMANHIHSQPRYTKRLILRPFKRRDVSAMHEAVSGSLGDLQPWLPWADGYDKGSAQRFVRESVAAWADGRAFDFAIRLIDDPDLHIGNVSVWPTSVQNKIAEIGYWISSSETGMGYGAEATTRAMQIGFEELGMHKLQLRI
ncbi:MAG: N-acetyltransferase, partial [Acidobacteria bacterium]